MKLRISSAAVGASLISVAACGGQSAPAAAPSTHAAAAASSQPTSAPPLAARLTMKQATAAYLRIVDPVNRAGATLKTDDTDQVPWSRYRADALALIAATRNADRQFGTARWPASVQPWVTAMMLTYDPADIGCLQAESKAGSYAAAQAAAAASQDCTAMANTADPDEIRSLLGLPPLTG